MQGRTNIIGTALMTLGGLPLAGLIGSAAASERTMGHFWGQWWFLLLVGIFGAVVLLGFYVVLAGEIDWLPPKKWTRETPSPEPPRQRIGIENEDTGRARIRNTRFGDKLDRGIRNQGELDVDDSDVE